MSATELRKLASLGLTGEQIAGVAEILDAREVPCAKPSRAERNRRYYEKRLSASERQTETSESVLIKTPPYYEKRLSASERQTDTSESV
jgi:hypothetical protein